MLCWRQLRSGPTLLAVFGGALCALILVSIEQRSNSSHEESSVFKPIAGKPAVEVADRSCIPQQSYYLLKVHKTGSTTTQNVALRYALRHNLTAMIPAPGARFTAVGWPKKPQAHHIVQHPYGERFHVLAHHSVYEKHFLKTFLRPSAKYIAIIRKPINQFLSAYFDFGLERQRKKTPQEFLDNPTVNEKKEKFPQGSVSITKNFMAMCFGYDTDQPDNMDAINNFLRTLANEFSLVLVIEHLDESLVLLRNLFCWDYIDIVYLKLHRSKGRESPNLSETQLQNHKKHSLVDYKLYEYFNKTLWQQVSQFPNFKSELVHFRDLNAKVNEYCQKATQSNKLSLGKDRKGNEMIVDVNVCRLMKLEDIEFTFKLSWKQYPDMDGKRFQYGCCQV